jgi:hypothetical protein
MWECKEEMGMNVSYIDVSSEEGKGIKVNTVGKIEMDNGKNA